MLNGVSAQRPSHSVFIGGEQLPLEARMGGIFLGFLCAVALVLVFGRLRASQPPHGALGLACWALVLVGVGVLLWPIALAMLAGVIVAFGVANLYIIVLATRRTHQALSLADARGGLISSFGLTLLELGALAALRSFLAATYGFSWGV